MGDDGQAPSGPGLTPDPRGTLTPLKAKPDPGLRPPFPALAELYPENRHRGTRSWLGILSSQASHP